MDESLMHREKNRATGSEGQLQSGSSDVSRADVAQTVR